MSHSILFITVKTANENNRGNDEEKDDLIDIKNNSLIILI